MTATRYCVECKSQQPAGHEVNHPPALFDRYPSGLYDGGPPHEAASTSTAAAASMATPSGKLRARVLSEIESAGGTGLTDDEIERLTGMRHQTASARRRELVLLGKVRSNGETRATSSGRAAKVWVSV